MEVPPTDGGTLFCDMAAGYEALPENMKTRLAGLTAIHSHLPRFNAARALDPQFQVNKFELSDEQKAALGEVCHPIVRTHPESGRKALFVNEGFTTRIYEPDASAHGDLLAGLFAHTKQHQFIYRHHWSADDLVFWDNRLTMHCATDYDLQYSRRMHRMTVQGDTPY